ncbi:hypothetical protein ABZ912_40145 [Nonomuraea angiospora]
MDGDLGQGGVLRLGGVQGAGIGIRVGQSVAERPGEHGLTGA